MKKRHRVFFILLILSAAISSISGFAKNSACPATFKKKCSKCHPLPSPLGFSKSMWDSFVERMAPNAKLSADEKMCIMNLNTTVIPE